MKGVWFDQAAVVAPIPLMLLISDWLLNDGMILLGLCPNRAKTHIDWVKSVRERHADKLKNATVVHCGHSLGPFLII